LSEIIGLSGTSGEPWRVLAEASGDPGAPVLDGHADLLLGGVASAMPR
jgi:hypothetical protein